MPDDNAILRFFRRKGPDSEGRMLDDILLWPDSELEFIHDYIQWIFPTRHASAFNPDAPIVGEAAIEAFRSDPQLPRALAAAFDRMMKFYGFDVRDENGKPMLTQSSDWDRRSANWVTRGNHNLLRITRIITSLRLLGLDDHAAAFFKALDSLYQSQARDEIGPVTYNFWKQAAKGG